MAATIDVPIAPPANVGEHKHCEACGKSIAMSGRVCSEACEAKVREAYRMRKRSVYTLIGAIVLLALFTYYGNRVF